MKNIDNIIKSINEIVIKIASNTNIQKYLITDDNDVNGATFTPLSIKEMISKKYICTTPQEDSTITTIGRNTFVVLLLKDINFNSGDDNNSSDVSVIINVITDLNHMNVNDGENRALILSNYIIQSIDGLKLSSSNKVDVDSIYFINYDELHCGYTISCNFKDQINQEVEL